MPYISKLGKESIDHRELKSEAHARHSTGFDQRNKKFLQLNFESSNGKNTYTARFKEKTLKDLIRIVFREFPNLK